MAALLIKHNCKTHGCYVEKHMPNWEIFRDCFPRGISVGDVDGMVEINGHVLWFEWKAKTASLSNAQRMAFLHASKFAPRQIWIVIWGDKGIPDRIEVIKDGRAKRFPASLDSVRHLVRRWARYADFSESNVVSISAHLACP